MISSIPQSEILIKRLSGFANICMKNYSCKGQQPTFDKILSYNF